MKKVNIFRTAATLLALLLAGTGCTDWLDANPRAQEDADKLFSTEDGFKEALSGCYINLCAPSVYGRELSFGMASVLGQEWKGNGVSDYNNAYYTIANKYNYEDVGVRPMADSIWIRLYNTAAQLNTLIEYTETKRDVLRDRHYAVIRGEALALRAFVHSDLYRLYGRHGADEGELSLPYLMSTAPGITPQATNGDFAKLIMKDIDDALELLETSDPAYTGEVLDGYDHGYFQNRHFHLNYYAVQALKARICLYIGDTQAALTAARAVINATDKQTLYRWVTLNEVNPSTTAERDRTFSSEHLFALNTRKLADNVEGYVYNVSASNANGPLMSRIDIATLYETGDYRLNLFETNNGIANVPSKLWQLPTQPKKQRMPMLRMTEAYYIAAECLAVTDRTEAIRLLNVVREHRGLDVKLENVVGTDDEGQPIHLNIMAEIQREYEREFLGEGQVFFFHKRMNTARVNDKAPDYIFPLPDRDWELGQMIPIKE